MSADRSSRDLARAAPSLLQPRPGAPAPSARRVLVVEDEAALRRVIAQNLRSRGVEVDEAATASDAIRAVRTGPPDLLLLDINLPDQTGWDVLRELRRREIEVPTIVLSAVRVTQSRLDEFEPLAYLPKPFPIEALLRLVLKEPAGSDSEDE